MGILKSISYDLHILEAMANSRSDGIKKVNKLLNPIVEHLVKIAIYSYKKDRAVQVEGWQKEIVKWLVQINRYCNNLKKNNKLKLSDYILCLNDDLGEPHLAKNHALYVECLYEGKCLEVNNPEQLRHILYSILEEQFKAMATQSWDINTLKQNPKYKDLTEYGYKELK